MSREISGLSDDKACAVAVSDTSDQDVTARLKHISRAAAHPAGEQIP